MHHTRTLVALVLASAGIVFATGLPWLLRKHRTPAVFVANEVATTEEIQEFDLMWAELESLQTKSAELGREQYRKQYLGSTIAFLQLDPEQKERFASSVDKSLERLGEARDRLASTTSKALKQGIDTDESRKDSWSTEHPDSVAIRRDAWGRWRDNQRESSDLLLSGLQASPRHELLAERRLLWLLKLDFSHRKAQEQVDF